MRTYISILRGINVSGQKIVKMEALRSLYEELNFINIQTYIQSGNVIFQYQSSDQEYLGKKISDQLLNNFGFDIRVILLNPIELKVIIGRNPFTQDGTKSISHQYVTFLSAKPVVKNIDLLTQKRTLSEEIVLIEKAVYLYCPNGYGRTKLTNSFIEDKLKVSATTRNWRTATELHNLAEHQKESDFTARE